MRMIVDWTDPRPKGEGKWTRLDARRLRGARAEECPNAGAAGLTAASTSVGAKALTWVDDSLDDQDNLREHKGLAIEMNQEIEAAIDVGEEEVDECMSQARDDVGSVFIGARLVKEARRQDIDFMKRKGICEDAPVQGCLGRIGNVAMSDSSNVRCRLVARDLL